MNTSRMNTKMAATYVLYIFVGLNLFSVVLIPLAMLTNLLFGIVKKPLFIFSNFLVGCAVLLCFINFLFDVSAKSGQKKDTEQIDEITKIFDRPRAFCFHCGKACSRYCTRCNYFVFCGRECQESSRRSHLHDCNLIVNAVKKVSSINQRRKYNFTAKEIDAFRATHLLGTSSIDIESLFHLQRKHLAILRVMFPQFAHIILLHWNDACAALFDLLHPQWTSIPTGARSRRSLKKNRSMLSGFIMFAQITQAKDVELGLMRKTKELARHYEISTNSNDIDNRTNHLLLAAWKNLNRDLRNYFEFVASLLSQHNNLLDFAAAFQAYFDDNPRESPPQFILDRIPSSFSSR
uniref:MYND-type domain-containing protein n=1 Tax=Aureoumbra lagunensis TaxID=44058 RepID=A0A6S8CRD1_9STRA|mmetsp:Transcript_13505/g.20149  ORF Transcript_13505/g.20149 Transcript_13505/m.20149 type:complete len:349 (+) Transcript_13505:184-1230(+)